MKSYDVALPWWSSASRCRGPRFDPGQKTRPHIPQLKKILHATTRILYAATKMPCAPTKTWRNEIILFKKIICLAKSVVDLRHRLQWRRNSVETTEIAQERSKIVLIRLLRASWAIVSSFCGDGNTGRLTTGLPGVPSIVYSLDL